MASKRASSRSVFNKKRRMSKESSEESDTELIQFSDQFVVTTLVDDSQGPARGVSGSSEEFVTCAVSADLRFPTSLDADLPPERFFTVNGEQYVVPDPERPFYSVNGLLMRGLLLPRP
jgi:hypothetical protein